MRVWLCMSDFASRRSLCICTTALHQVNVSCVFPSCWGQREEVETFLGYCVTGAEERRCSWWLINAKLVVSGACFPELPSRAPGAKLPQGQCVDPLEIDEGCFVFCFFFSPELGSHCVAHTGLLAPHILFVDGVWGFFTKKIFFCSIILSIFSKFKNYTKLPNFPQNLIFWLQRWNHEGRLHFSRQNK